MLSIFAFTAEGGRRPGPGPEPGPGPPAHVYLWQMQNVKTVAIVLFRALLHYLPGHFVPSRMRSPLRYTYIYI